MLVICVLVIENEVDSFNKLNLLFKFVIFNINRVVFYEQSLASIHQELHAIIIQAWQYFLVLELVAPFFFIAVRGITPIERIIIDINFPKHLDFWF